MSNKRVINLPLAGIDARYGLNINPESVSEAVNVRASEEDLRDYSYMAFYKNGPTVRVDVARNIVQMFMSPAGGLEGIDDQNRIVMMTATGAHIYNNTTGAWTTIETGYSLKPTTIPGGGTALPRFAIANTQHKLVWTCAQANTDIRVRVYDGTGSGPVPIPQQYAARHLIALNNRIVLGDTFENNTTRNASRLRWCVNRNFMDWTGEGSGFLDVSSYNSSGRILALNNLGPSAIIGLEREFIELIPTGSLFPVFQLGEHFSVPPIMAPRSWQVLNDTAFYLGPDSVYAWTRGRKSEKIGKPIERLLAPYLVAERMDTIQSVLMPSREEYRLLMTSGSNEGTATAKIFIFDTKAGRWFVEETDTMNAISKVLVVKQGGSSFSAPFSLPGTLEYGIAAGLQDNFHVEQAPGAPRPQPKPYFTTQDILAINTEGAPDVNARNEFLNLYFRTAPLSTVDVYYSIDRGASYTGTTIASNSDGVGIFSGQVSFSTIRFRFQDQFVFDKNFYITGPIVMEWEQIGTIY